jgi:hypothetical protein
MGFDLSNYETVESRLARFWEAYPDGRVETCLMNYDGDSCVFRAELYRHRDDEKPTSTGYAHEIRTDRGVNMTSFIENGETSAIGRAAANFIFATQGKRPSREEMQKSSVTAGKLNRPNMSRAARSRHRNKSGTSRNSPKTPGSTISGCWS